MKIACDFHWEMGHRIAEHPGLCRNLHGHSYHMRVTVDGAVQSSGMVMDFFDLKNIVQPVVDSLDHCFLCATSDEVMQEFFKGHPMKVVTVPFATTAENIAQYFLDQVRAALVADPALTSITVRVQETDSSFAEAYVDLTRDAS